MPAIEMGALSGTTRVVVMPPEPNGSQTRWFLSGNITNLDTVPHVLTLEMRKGHVRRVLRKLTVPVNSTLTWTSRVNGDIGLPDATYAIEARSDAAASTTEPDYVTCWDYER